MTLGVVSLQQNVNAIYEYLRVLSSKQVNPLIIPPDALRGVLAHIKNDMKRNPRLQLPEDPNINIWNYYPIMKITPIVMDDFLLIILTHSINRPIFRNEPLQSLQLACITS